MKFILFIVFLFGILFVGYKYLFSGNPRDLGVKYTEADRVSAYTKNAVESVKIESSSDSIKDSVRYEGKKDINIVLTGPEITALNNARNWKFKTAYNVQFRINPDGTGEVSGIINTANILPYISLTHSTAEVEKAMKDFKISVNPPFYLKGKVSIVNNQVDLEAQQIEIGRITVPGNLVSENLPAVENFVEDRLNAIPNLNVRSLIIEDGGVKIDATVPEKEFTVQN